DIVVWNSGGPPPSTALEISDELLEAAFELLLVPAVRLVRLALPHLEQSAAGRIVCITSAAVKEPTAHLALSNTIRPGLTGWAKTLANELGPTGITVNCVAPGRIDTPRMKEVYGEDGPSPEQLAQIPLGRLGTPREFGDVVCFVDVVVRKATLLERLFGGLHDGADLYPPQAVNPPGVNQRQRHVLDLQDMHRSQQIAAAVALRAAGKKVVLRPVGARIGFVEQGLPA